MFGPRGVLGVPVLVWLVAEPVPDDSGEEFEPVSQPTVNRQASVNSHKIPFFMAASLSLPFEFLSFSG